MILTLSVWIQQAAEDRSQHKNRSKAFKRLREVIAIEGDYLFYFQSEGVSVTFFFDSVERPGVSRHFVEYSDVVFW